MEFTTVFFSSSRFVLGYHFIDSYFLDCFCFLSSFGWVVLFFCVNFLFVCSNDLLVGHCLALKYLRGRSVVANMALAGPSGSQPAYELGTPCSWQAESPVSRQFGFETILVSNRQLNPGS